MRAAGGIATAIDDASLGEITRRAIAHAGLTFYAEKEDALTGKIDRRMRALGLARHSEYLRLLEGSGGRREWGALIDEITIGETFFFRYPSQWDALRETIIPACLAQGEQESLRILCAGCANGAEPYTLSIMAQQELRTVLGGRSLSILGVDISETRIEQARAGVYGAWDLRALPEGDRSCFEATGAGWRLKDEYRRGVEFNVVNIVAAGSIEARHLAEFDIILCRNVMIYFSAETNRRLLQTFHTCLKDGGWFITGHAEPYLEISNVFRPHAVDGSMFYRKQSIACAATVQPSPPKTAARTRQLIHSIAERSQAFGMANVEPPLPSEDDVTKARRFANAGQWREAQALCDRLADADPFNAEIQFLTALICDHIGQGRAAEASLRRAIYLDTDFALAHYHLAIALAGNSDKMGAARSLRNVFKCLGEARDVDPVPCGDGLSAGDLRRLAHMQLGVLGEAGDDR